MTLISRKNPRIIRLPIALTTASLLTWGAAAQDLDLPDRSAEPTSPRASVGTVANRGEGSIRVARSTETRGASRPAAGPKRRQDEKSDDRSTSFSRISKEIPKGNALFEIYSETDFIRSLETGYRSSTGDDKTAYLPTPLDRFSFDKYENLGLMWLQNNKSGKHRHRLVDEDGKESFERKRGDMQIEKLRGVHRAGSPAEVAIFNGSLDVTNVVVSIDVELGGTKSEFGVVLRAGEPGSVLDFGSDRNRRDDDEQPVDQVKSNSFMFAICTPTRVRIGKSVEGKVTILKEATIASKTKFNLSFTSVGDNLRAFRDDVEVASAVDGSFLKDPKHRFIGLYAESSDGAGTYFDNFIAIRYGGSYSTRQFAASTLKYKSSNVHYWPLYFEQISAERYGHHLGNLFQPAYSHLAFCVDFLALPYSMAKAPPRSFVDLFGLPFQGKNRLQNDQGLPPAGKPKLPYTVYPPVADRKAILTQIGVTALVFSVVP